MNKRKGFTLIELLLVMVIMGILVLIGTGAFVSSLLKGRDTTRKANLRGIASALEMYYNDNGRYPADDGIGGMKGCLGGVGLSPTPAPSLCSANFIDAKGTLYMAKLPTDPVSTQKYYYVSATGANYQIYAHLENTQDPQCLLLNCAPNGLMCGTVGCNYGISSANTNP